MPNAMLRPGLTFVLACASATLFLFLRCHGSGSPFGRHSRKWALLVILATSVLSTVVEIVGVTLVDHLPGIFVGVGLVGPSGLWLSEIRSRRDAEQPSMLRDLLTLWLSRLLARMHEGMAEDRDAWCEGHIDEAWSADELSAAARYYQEYMRERMSPAERRRSRINVQLNAIEARLTAVALIENGAAKSKIVAALPGSKSSKDSRYTRNLNDVQRMADILHHDAERELVRLLGHAYTAGLQRMPVYQLPRRTYSEPPAAPAPPAAQVDGSAAVSAAARMAGRRNPQARSVRPGRPAAGD